MLRDSNGRFISAKADKKNFKKSIQKLLEPIHTLPIPKQTKTYVSIILDESGSMLSLKTSTLKFINTLINTIKSNSAKYGQETLFSFTTFSNSVRHRDQCLHIEHQEEIQASEYHPGGGTSLFDAVGQSIQNLERVDNGQDAFLVYAITDGYENSSKTFNATQIKALIQAKQSTDRWTLAFHVPRGNKNSLLYQFGISNDNVQEWDQTEAGVKEVEQQTSGGISNYYDSRSKGHAATKTFFADLSNISINQVEKKLDDLSNNFKTFAVEKETPIKDFVEEKTRKAYNPGTAYYEVTKDEKIQAYKKILVMQRGKRSIYGGQQARDLIKLPNQDVKLKIKNLNEYRLFVSSNSNNRVLVRGTTLIVEK